jgi:hypothetical protein
MSVATLTEGEYYSGFQNVFIHAGGDPPKKNSLLSEVGPTAVKYQID